MSNVRTRVVKDRKEKPVESRIDAKENMEPMRLHYYHELDEWQKDNHYIKSGYVRGTNSYKATIKSLFFIHNETGNIYSHLLPSMVILISLIYYLQFHITVYEDLLKFWEWCNFLQFGLAATFCLGMSSIFHCIKSHSHKVAKFGNLLDYFGIIILITCSLISIILFAFHDDLLREGIYSVIFLSLGSLCTFFTLDPKFSSPVYRPMRSTIFVLFGLSGILPVIDSLYYLGVETTNKRAGLNWLILEGFFYISGAALYAARVPERFTHIEEDEVSLLNNPISGMFDIWGHSHQIFHVFVVIAAFCHWRALLQCYHYMHETA